MAKDIHIGEMISVPRIRIGLDGNSQSAIYIGKVIEINNRSVKINLPRGGVSDFIPTSAIQKIIKIMIIRIGDFDTEYTLLDPLQKSILHYFRLLLSDEEIINHSVRSLTELSRIWIIEHKSISHVVFIGHGRKNGIKFGDDWVSPVELSNILTVDEVSPKQFISLCCETGYADFGKIFSKFYVCESLICPFQSVHGSIASQFCQTYFAYHLLHGETSGVAFKHARNFTPGATSFRLWKNEVLLAGQKTY